MRSLRSWLPAPQVPHMPQDFSLPSGDSCDAASYAATGALTFDMAAGDSDREEEEDTDPRTNWSIASLSKDEREQLEAKKLLAAAREEAKRAEGEAARRKQEMRARQAADLRRAELINQPNVPPNLVHVQSTGSGYRALGVSADHTGCLGGGQSSSWSVVFAQSFRRAAAEGLVESEHAVDVYSSWFCPLCRQQVSGAHLDAHIDSYRHRRARDAGRDGALLEEQWRQGLLPPWMEVRQQFKYCTLCLQWATTEHLGGKNHEKKLYWHDQNQRSASSVGQHVGHMTSSVPASDMQRASEREDDLPTDWESTADPQGRVYYYKVDPTNGLPTNCASWDRPSNPSNPSKKALPSSSQPTVGNSTSISSDPWSSGTTLATPSTGGIARETKLADAAAGPTSDPLSAANVTAKYYCIV